MPGLRLSPQTTRTATTSPPLMKSLKLTQEEMHCESWSVYVGISLPLPYSQCFVHKVCIQLKKFANPHLATCTFALQKYSVGKHFCQCEQSRNIKFVDPSVNPRILHIISWHPVCCGTGHNNIYVYHSRSFVTFTGKSV